MKQLRHESQSDRRGSSVQAESRLRVSGESDTAATAELIRLARLAQDQQRALHTTVHESSASTKAISAAAGISYQFLCNAANPDLQEQLPFPRLPGVLSSCDDLTFLGFLAALQHAMVIRLPKGGAAGDIRRAGATMREFAEFMEASAEALEDGRVLAAEFEAIEREGLDAVRAILATIEDYRGRVERQGQGSR